MAKLHTRPSNQYRYEHYDSVSSVAIRSKKSAAGGMNFPKPDCSLRRRRCLWVASAHGNEPSMCASSFKICRQIASGKPV
jgi:hypothetical protein